MNLLGVDFGLKNIGLALSVDRMVEPAASVKVTPPLLPLKKDMQVVRMVRKLCQENHVEKIILGLPEGRIRNKVIEFARQLSVLVEKPVEFFDENLTTQEAVAKMIESGRGKKYRQEKKDAVAAAVILQNYQTSLNV